MPGEPVGAGQIGNVEVGTSQIKNTKRALIFTWGSKHAFLRDRIERREEDPERLSWLYLGRLRKLVLGDLDFSKVGV